MKFEWEKISDINAEMTYRAKVIGGWIVKNWEAGDSPSVSMVFIYDPVHDWTIEE